jgi:hypothetical protein
LETPPIPNPADFADYCVEGVTTAVRKEVPMSNNSAFAIAVFISAVSSWF